MSHSGTSYIAHVRKSDGMRQYVGQHLLGVSEKTGDRAAKIGLREFGQLLGLLHDLGKYSEEFRKYIESSAGILDPDADEYVDARAKKGKIDHSTAGAQHAFALLSAKSKVGEIAVSIAALCLASHHSGLIDCISPNGTDILSTRLAKAATLTRLSEATANIELLVNERINHLLSDPEWMTAVVRKCRAVQSEKSQLRGDFNIGLLARFLFGCLTDADGRDSADFENPRAAAQRQNGKYTSWEALVDRLDRHISSLGLHYPVDKIRTEISRVCVSRAKDPRGVFTLTVPTGGGKTLASLRFALNHAMQHKMDRVLFFVPFTTIIDQNAQVVRKVLETNDVDLGKVVLEHHSNLMPERQTWINKILSEDWDAPIVFTTTVQLLEALFGGGTQAARRMHQLSNSVLIFDEVQALPIGTTHMFCNAINFLTRHCDSTVVLCTATQPLLNGVDDQKGRIDLSHANEIVPDVESLFAQLRRVDISDLRRPNAWHESEIATLVDDEMDRSGNCLVVVNTKKSAQSLYELEKSRYAGSIYHLSAGMCPAHRAVVLDAVRQCLAKDKGVLCISTQVIEAGIDVDFGSVIRYVAGLDSIAQSAGRCNRNGKTTKGHVLIANPTDENLDMLHDIKEGKEQAIRVLDEFKRQPADFKRDILGPTAIEMYFKYYFFNRKSQMDYPIDQKDKRGVGRDDTLLSLLSSNGLSLEEFSRQFRKDYRWILRQSFMSAAKAFSAIDAPTRGVVVQYKERGKQLVGELCATFDIERQFALLREAQQYSVNLYPHQLQQLERQGALHEVQESSGILFVEKEYYSEEFGLSMSPVEFQDAMFG